MKKHKLIDKLKSWSIALGIGALCGGLAFAVDGVQKYTKACAYEYQDNGTLVFGVSDNVFDTRLLFNFIKQNSGLSISFNIFDIDNVSSAYTDGISFGYDNGSQVAYFDNENDDTYFYISYLNNSFEISAGDIMLGTEYRVSIDYNSIGYQEIRNFALSYNESQSDGNFLSALTDFMQLLGGAIVQLAQPIANGVTEFARDLFIDNNHLSILGGVIGIFAGIALAVGITTKVYTWVTSLGN